MIMVQSSSKLWSLGGLNKHIDVNSVHNWEIIFDLAILNQSRLKFNFRSPLLSNVSRVRRWCSLEFELNTCGSIREFNTCDGL